MIILKIPQRIFSVLLSFALLAAGAHLHAQSTGLVVTSSNNVGIGTTSPPSFFKFDVRGQIAADDGSNDYVTLGQDPGGSSSPTTFGGMYFDANKNLRIEALSGGVAWRNIVLQGQGSGNVGIGTTNPTDKLVVSSFNDPASSYGLSIGAYPKRLALGYLDSGNGGTGYGYVISTNTGTAYTPLVFQQYGGNVGIGTTSPGSKLEVASSDTVLRVSGSSTANQSVIRFVTGGSNRWDIGVNDYIASSGGTLEFSQSGAFPNMVIASSGKVGIGTTSPSMALTVKGPNVIADLQSTAASALLYFTPSGYHQWRIGAGEVNVNDFGIRDMTANVNRLAIDSNGNVGIGTTSPGYKLDVAGQVHADSFVSSTQTYADFVFKPDYKLASLSQVEASIKKEGHLPGIPSEEEAKAHGIDITQMQVKLLQKIEELTLHVISQEKRLDDQSKRIDELEKENAQLRQKLIP